MYFMSISTFSSFFMNLQNLLNMVFMSYYHLFDGFTRFLFPFQGKGGGEIVFHHFITPPPVEIPSSGMPLLLQKAKNGHIHCHTRHPARPLVVNDDDLDLLLLGCRGLQIAGHTYLFLSLLQHIT